MCWKDFVPDPDAASAAKFGRGVPKEGYAGPRAMQSSSVNFVGPSMEVLRRALESFVAECL